MSPHILIIDDEANNLEVLAQLLEAQHITCSLVKDPSQTFKILANLQQLDAVILDLEMPKMDGYQLLALLREELGRSVPIICSSVHLSEIDTARRVGFDGFLGKPLDADRFPRLVQGILNGQSIWELP